MLISEQLQKRKTLLYTALEKNWFRLFSCARPRAWNSLPSSCTNWQTQWHF